MSCVAYLRQELKENTVYGPFVAEHEAGEGSGEHSGNNIEVLFRWYVAEPDTGRMCSR